MLQTAKSNTQLTSWLPINFVHCLCRGGGGCDHCCSKYQLCFVRVSNTSPTPLSAECWVDNEWIFIFGWTIPLINKIKLLFSLLSTERRWLFSQDQGSTYLLYQPTMYERCLCIMWLNMKYLSIFFLSSWSTKFFLPRTRAERHAGDLRIRRIHIFRSVCAALLQNMNTLDTQLLTNNTTVHFLLGGGGGGGGETPLMRKPNLFTRVWVTSFVCAYKKAGRRDQKLVWTISLYCNLFYSTFPWRKFKKKSLPPF